MAGIKNSKDYSLETLVIHTSVASFDLKLSMIEMSYVEDLFASVCSGYILIAEATGFIETLALNGTEYLRVRFSKFGDDTSVIDKLFRVYKVSRRRLEGTMYKESYVINFCSDELLLSEQYKISKRYKNSLISDNINDILKNYLKTPSKRIGTIEPTYGQYDFIIPTLKPFDAINFMLNYARPNPQNPGADMVFYEDKNGFQLRSLQTLMKIQPYNAYSYKPKNLQTNNLQVELYNILSYEILDSFDTLNGITSGTFANQLISANPMTRQKKVTNFDYGVYFQNSKDLNLYPVIDNSINRKGDGLNQTYQSQLKLIFSNTDNKGSTYISSVPGAAGNDIFAETYIPYRTAQLGLANYTRVRIVIPGDCNLTIGRVITFNLGTRQPNSSALDKYYSGNYLITGVKHIIDLTSYRTILEITKESVSSQYPSTDNTNGLWKAAISGNI
jgi:hypothetical protein